ncbi:hypothetical protein ABT324_30275 [Saccharopolyspora sp. NPDC000359]|uniref:hypothetical protein n=1 Tax=Saccharopolyspora sp. NPDC000359 TaxID=3154251 RepID=UPI003333183C
MPSSPHRKSIASHDAARRAPCASDPARSHAGELRRHHWSLRTFSAADRCLGTDEERWPQLVSQPLTELADRWQNL